MKVFDYLSQVTAVTTLLIRDAQRWGLGRAEAEDAAQDVWTRMLGRQLDFEGPAQLCAYARRALQWRMHDRRRKIRAVELDGLPEDRVLSGAGRGPLDEAIAKDEGELIADALMQLPERHRRALILCKIMGCSHPAIAAELGVAPNTVRTFLYRGTAQLRKLLEYNGGDDGRA